MLLPIGQTIKEFLTSSRNSSSISKTELREGTIKPSGFPVVDESLAIIKKRRLSKTTILQIIDTIDPTLSPHFSRRRELRVDEILMELPETTAERLLELLKRHHIKEDEYLSGIMRERH